MDIYAKLNAIQMMIDNNEITDEDFPYIQMVLKKMQEEVQTMIKQGDIHLLASNIHTTTIKSKRGRPKKLKKSKTKSIQSGGSDGTSNSLIQEKEEESEDDILQKSIDALIDAKNKINDLKKDDSIIGKSVESLIEKEIGKKESSGFPPNPEEIVSNEYSESSGVPGCIVC